MVIIPDLMSSTTLSCSGFVLWLFGALKQTHHYADQDTITPTLRDNESAVLDEVGFRNQIVPEK